MGDSHDAEGSEKWTGECAKKAGLAVEGVEGWPLNVKWRWEEEEAALAAAAWDWD